MADPEPYKGTYADGLARATAWMDAMASYKGAFASTHITVEQRYERLRERYVHEQIDLEEFAAEVVGLLRDGF